MTEVPNLVLDDANDIMTPRAPSPGPAVGNSEPAAAGDEEKRPESASAAPSQNVSAATPEQVRPRRSRHGISYHCGFLFLGFLAICLAGYVLANNGGDCQGRSTEDSGSWGAGAQRPTVPDQSRRNQRTQGRSFTRTRHFLSSPSPLIITLP
jgi:hypothetical protein